MKNSGHKLDFLRAKLHMLAGYFDPAMIEPLKRLIDQVASHPMRMPKNVYDDIDYEFDKILLTHTEAKNAEDVRAKLTARFGYSSLDLSPETKLIVVLKRGKILDEKEAKLIQDYLSDDLGGHSQTVETRTRLGVLLRAYEMTHDSN